MNREVCEHNVLTSARCDKCEIFWSGETMGKTHYEEMEDKIEQLQAENADLFRKWSTSKSVAFNDLEAEVERLKKDLKIRKFSASIGSGLTLEAVLDRAEKAEAGNKKLLKFMGRLAESHSQLSQAEYDRNPSINDASPIMQIEHEYIALVGGLDESN